MATNTELLKEVLTNAGGDASSLPDNLITTILKAIVDTIGGSGSTSPTISVSSITGGHRITITDINGTKTVDVMNGAAGAKGNDGVGISTIAQTTTSTADGGNNVFTVTLTNGQTAAFTVKNGTKGSTGSAGANGTAGKSAYQYAQDGGYTGTEEQFATALAQLVAAQEAQTGA